MHIFCYCKDTVLTELGFVLNKIELSLQYLSCLTTSRSLTDKLAFDVGLQEDSIGKTFLNLHLHDYWYSVCFRTIFRKLGRSFP